MYRLTLGLSLSEITVGSKALASILYQTLLGDFVYTTDTSSNMLLVNSGDTGSVNNGLLYSGRGIELGALNDVTVGDAAKWTTYFDFATATHVKVFGVQVLNTKTVNSILVSANEPSAETLSIFDANPNLVGKLALSATGTIPEVDLTLVASDSYYMCSEKSGTYLVDSRATRTNIPFVSLPNAYPLFDVGTGATGSSTQISGSEIDVAITVAGTGISTLNFQSNVNGTLGDIHLVKIETILNSGTLTLSTTQYGNSGRVTNVIPMPSVYYFLVVCNDDTLPLLELRFDNSTTFNANIKATIENIGNFTSIANYTETIRTNADLQQKGIQTTAFVTDGAGVPTAYSSNLLQFNGDGRYGDTKLIPDITKPLTIKLLCTSPTSYPEVRAMNGTDLDDVTNRVAIGFNAGNIPQLYFGNIAISDTLKTAGSLNSLVMVWDLTTVYFYVNGAFINSGVPSIVNGSKTFLLGKLNELVTTMVLADPLGMPDIRFKALSASDVSTEYAQDKLIYPTLP